MFDKVLIYLHTCLIYFLYLYLYLLLPLLFPLFFLINALISSNYFGIEVERGREWRRRDDEQVEILGAESSRVRARTRTEWERQRGQSENESGWRVRATGRGREREYSVNSKPLVGGRAKNRRLRD